MLILYQNGNRAGEGGREGGLVCPSAPPPPWEHFFLLFFRSWSDGQTEIADVLADELEEGRNLRRSEWTRGAHLLVAYLETAVRETLPAVITYRLEIVRKLLRTPRDISRWGVFTAINRLDVRTYACCCAPFLPPPPFPEYASAFFLPQTTMSV